MKMEITTERGTYILAGTPEEMAALGFICGLWMISGVIRG